METCMNEELKNENEAQEKEYAFKAIMNGKQNSRVWSALSLAAGIISIVFSYFSWFALICGIIAVALAVFSRINLGYFDGIAIAGLITGIFGIVFGLAGVIAYHVLEATGSYDRFISELGKIFG